jgi:hypothetical protein
LAGSVDTSAILAFTVSSSNALVSIWYDQVGSRDLAIQAGSPTIAISGSMVTMHNKPAIRFPYGSWLAKTTNYYYGLPNTVIAVAGYATGGTVQTMSILGGTSDGCSLGIRSSPYGKDFCSTAASSGMMAMSYGNNNWCPAVGQTGVSIQPSGMHMLTVTSPTFVTQCDAIDFSFTFDGQTQTVTAINDCKPYGINGNTRVGYLRYCNKDLWSDGWISEVVIANSAPSVSTLNTYYTTTKEFFNLPG